MAAQRLIDLYPAAVLANTPACYWECQEVSGALADASGNGNPSSGGAVSAYRQPGALPDLSDASIRLDSAATVTVGVAAGGKSFALWFKGITLADSKILMYAGNPAGDGSGVMVNADATLSYLCGGIAVGGKSVGVVSTSVFTRVLMTVSTGSSPYTFKYYINGDLDAATPATSGINTPTGSLFIGEPGGGLSGYWSHCVSFAATLTAAQAKAEYRAALAETRLQFGSKIVPMGAAPIYRRVAA